MRSMVEERACTNMIMKNEKQKHNQCIPFMIDKSCLSEYISSNSSPNEEPCVKEELTNISSKDETAVIRYLLEIMKKHGIITEEEYQAVLYKV